MNEHIGEGGPAGAAEPGFTPVPAGDVMIVQTLVNAYLMPDGVVDDEDNDIDEVQSFYADPIWKKGGKPASVRWRFESDSDVPGAYRIRSLPHEKYVGVHNDWVNPDGTMKPEAKVVLQRTRTSARTSTQLWVPTRIPGVADVAGQPPVRALVQHGTEYAMGTSDYVLNRDAEIHLIRTWEGVPTMYHAFTLIPARDQQASQDVR